MSRLLGEFYGFAGQNSLYQTNDYPEAIKLLQPNTTAICTEEKAALIAFRPREMSQPVMELKQLCRMDDLLLSCTDEALVDLVGVAVRDAIYQNLETTHLIPKTKIPEHLDDFFQLLKGTFGKGSGVIGKAIAKKLYRKLNWEFIDVPRFEFFDYLEMVRARLARNPVAIM